MGSQARAEESTTRFSRSDITSPATTITARNSGRIHIPVQVASTPKAGGASVEPV
jgi:uncharacterized phosphosugar-binding protein